MGSDDELAQTATAPASGGTPTAPASGGTPTDRESRASAPLTTLERYVIEGPLGAGGMGIVYRAFDPDLERHVALKVLHDGSTHEQRLLREARAMARLAHPNVVTVYEVGTVSGRDYIAMELIDGASLVDWLRGERRSEREIVDAYLAAGRGLAAAHEAGIVHRDFKPHNVLRSKGGRIVVTDFGLAADRPDHAVTAASRNTPTALSGLTETGATLGTPAYMAPEQWAGAKVTPASDQFAFCVAVWEALDGERPFKGDTPDVLRGAIERGPRELDATRIPRRLRAPLLRGLSIDPAERWPSMTALLSALEPRRGRIVIAIAAAAALAATATIVVLARGGNEAARVIATCEAPVMDPATVWTAENDADVRKHQPAVARLFTSEVATWRKQREAACKLPDAQRRSRLACLDRVLARLAALRDARMLQKDAMPDGLYRQIYSADVCALPSPPKLPERYSDAAVLGLAARAGYQFDRIAYEEAEANTTNDPCAEAAFALVKVQYERTVKNAEAARNAAERCDDAQLYGAALLTSISVKLRQVSTHDITELLAEGERAVKAAAHPMLTSQWRTMLGDIALDANRLDEALEHFTAAYQDRPGVWDGGLVTVRRLGVLAARGRLEDLEQIRREAAGWKAALIVNGMSKDAIAAFEWYDALAAWRLGDEEAAGKRLNALARQLTFHFDNPEIQGVIVDESGAPVDKATIWAGASLGDSYLGVIPTDELPTQRLRWMYQPTEADGAFAIPGTPSTGTLVAEAGELRSLAMPFAKTVRMQLRATGSVRGRVKIEGARIGDFKVTVRPLAGARPYEIAAPVRADGTFEVGRIPRGKALVFVKRAYGSDLSVAAPRTVEVRATPVDIDLVAPSGRVIDVFVRSTSSLPIHQATVYAFARTAAPRTVRELEIAMETVASGTANARASTKEPPPKPGDLHARVSAPESGTLCAVGVQVDERDPAFWDKLEAQRLSLEAKCQPYTAGDDRIVVEVPPMKRLE